METAAEDKKIHDIARWALQDGQRERDFASYGAQMDASLVDKLERIQPYVRSGLIVDKGCGTGMLALKLQELYPDSAVVGLDMSEVLLARAQENTGTSGVKIIKGDVLRPHWRLEELGPVDTIIMSSVLHEVYSYTGYSLRSVQRALRLAWTELRPGSGRLIIRDGVQPESPDLLVMLTFIDQATQRLFVDFSQRYRGGVGCFADWEGKRDVITTHRAANEFLCKKDYLKHWDLELQEEFAISTENVWRKQLLEAGFEIMQSYSYVNDWVSHHRYEPKVRLYDRSGARRLQWPATNILLVGEKPE